MFLDSEEILKKMASFFAENFCESKIVNPGKKDTVHILIVFHLDYVKNRTKALGKLGSIVAETLCFL